MTHASKKITAEEFWKGMTELKKYQQETGRQIRNLHKSQEETNRQMKETDRRIDEANGNFNNKWGMFLENLVEGDLVRLLNQRGIEVRNILSRVKHLRSDKSVECEYDLIAVNGSEVVVFEVKTTLSVKSLNSFLKKLKKFRSQFPRYGNEKIYGGIAYMKSDTDVDTLSMEKGLFLIKSPGGQNKVSTLVNSKNFVPKTF